MTGPFVKNILMLSVLCASISRALSADLAITPATATNDYVGKTVIAVTGIAPGKSIRVEKYFDLNANGVVDKGDALAQSFIVIDGAEPAFFVDGADRVRNWNIPADEDGAANGQIRVELPSPSIDGVIDLIEGAYLFKVSDPANGFAPVTRVFATKQKTLPQGVSGRITAAGTGNPLANAPVLLMPPDGSPVTGAFTDANGRYTLYSAPGLFVVIPLVPGFVADFSGVAAVVNGGLTTVNLSVPAATRIISGKLKDSSSSAGIPGVLLLAQSNAGQLSTAFTDSAGDFSLPVLAGEWQITPESGALALLGYVGLREEATVAVSTVNGNMANVSLAVSKADALIYGTLKDGQNQPISGIQIWANDSKRLYETKGLSFAIGGNFCLGVVSGSWQLQPDEEALATFGYLSQDISATVGSGRAVRVDIGVRRVTAHLRGRLVESNGTPVGNMRIGASDHASTWISTQTDANGQFDIGISRGAWYLQLESNEAQERSLLGPDLPAFNVVDGADQGNITVIARRVTGEIAGSVKSDNGKPIEGLGVFSSTTVNGIKYTDWIRTDSSGNYRLRAFNGAWQLDLDCSELQFRGYNCPPATRTDLNSGRATVNLMVSSSNPLRITTTALPHGSLGAPYKFQLSASGGQPAYQWSLALGSANLPPGLSLSNDGVLSGSPTGSGTFNFILVARDRTSASVSQAFSITISGQATLSLPARLSSTQFRLSLSGNPGQNYTLQYSDTLTSWTTLLITNAPAASFSMTDQNATNAFRFYRIVIGP